MKKIGNCDMGNSNHKNRIRREGGNMVGGDPVGSTDPEVKRNTIPSPYRRVNCLHAPFWRSNAHWCMFWALNAHVMLVSGVERQFQACFWRSAPDCPLCAHPGVKRQVVACFWRSALEWCSVLALNAGQMHLLGVERQPVRPPG